MFKLNQQSLTPKLFNYLPLISGNADPIMNPHTTAPALPVPGSTKNQIINFLMSIVLGDNRYSIYSYKYLFLMKYITIHK